MLVNVRLMIKLKWVFCFLGEYFMVVIKIDIFMNVIMFLINMVDMDNVIEIEKVGVWKVIFGVLILDLL